MNEWHNSVLTGDCVERLNDLPESSVHMCMTSPPYFGLRDYGVDGQIGLEDSLDEYISELVAVGDALRRVLRDDGSWWLNLGDSYATARQDHTGGEQVGGAPDADYATRKEGALGRKNKMLVPHRVAIALQDAGWIVRNDVTWHKPNPMPSSVKDRLNTTTEQIFHLTPNPDYWYDLDAIREDYAEATKEDVRGGYGWGENKHNGEDSPHGDGGVNDGSRDRGDFMNPNGKNPGDVFEVTTKPFPDAHFAVYPPELCEKPIKATAPPKVCAECGSPYIRESVNAGVLTNPTGREQKQRAIELFEQSDLEREHLSALRSIGFTDAGQAQEVYDGHGRNADGVETRAKRAKDVLGGYAREFIGRETESTEWVKGCDCDTDATEPGIVLDPFAGAGTTLLKAKDLARRFVGIELNPEYADMARERLGLSLADPSNARDEEQSGLDSYSRSPNA
jgi:DNA modification methylase